MNLNNLALALRHCDNLAEAISNWERVKDLRATDLIPPSADGGLMMMMHEFGLSKCF